MFSTIKQLVFSSSKVFTDSDVDSTMEKETYKKYCETVNEKIKLYGNAIDDYMYENGGKTHLERLYDREPHKRKYTDFYGFLLFKLLEEENTHRMNQYVKKHGFELLFHRYLETHDDVYTYYDVYGNRTPHFNRWILSNAYAE